MKYLARTLVGAALSVAVVSSAFAVSIVRPGGDSLGGLAGRDKPEYAEALRDADETCKLKHGPEWEGKITQFLVTTDRYNEYWVSISYYCLKN